jgi:hypothetical protein
VHISAAMLARAMAIGLASSLSIIESVIQRIPVAISGPDTQLLLAISRMSFRCNDSETVRRFLLCSSPSILLRYAAFELLSAKIPLCSFLISLRTARHPFSAKSRLWVRERPSAGFFKWWGVCRDSALWKFHLYSYL